MFLQKGSQNFTPPTVAEPALSVSLPDSSKPLWPVGQRPAAGALRIACGGSGRVASQPEQLLAPAAVSWRITGKLGPLEPIKVAGVEYVEGLWPYVNGSWQTVKMDDADAIWSPRDGVWYDHPAAGGGGSGGIGGGGISGPGNALEQRLAEIEAMENAKPAKIDAVTANQLRSKALRDYEQQMGTKPP